MTPRILSTNFRNADYGSRPFGMSSGPRCVNAGGLLTFVLAETGEFQRQLLLGSWSESMCDEAADINSLPQQISLLTL